MAPWGVVLRLYLGLAGCALLFSCGGSGRDTAPSPPQKPAAGSFNLSSTNVSGRFVLGTEQAPAQGYSLWLFGQTTATFEEVPLDEAGAVRIPLAHFAEGSSYSLHLTKDFDWIADIDLAQETPGLQPTFSYQGGLGFDFGQVTLPVPAPGAHVRPGAAVSLPIGGGFKLEPSLPGAFTDYRVPIQLERLQFSSQLYVFDPGVLLYSFYTRNQHPDAYAQDLRRLYRLGFLLTARDDTLVVAAALSRTGSWQKAARTTAADELGPEAAALLGDLPAELHKTAPGRYELSLYSGGMPSATATAVVAMRPNSGPVVALPRLLARRLSFPPQVVGVAAGGRVPAAIDYTAAAGTNGLTRPFCQQGEMVLELNPPLDAAGQTVPVSVFDRIEAHFDYYQVSSGKTVPATVGAGAFAAPYQAVVKDSSQVEGSRVWQPAAQTLTLTLGTSSAAATQQLRLWSPLFSPTTTGAAVSAVRVRLYYFSDAEGTSAATAAWFKPGC